MALLDIKSLHKSFLSGNDTLEVLKDVSLSVEAGEQLVLTGASGSGKSTLLHLIGSMDIPDSGSIEIDGMNIVGKNETELTQFRLDKIGFVFQFHYLLPEFTALENVAVPAMISGHSHKEAKKMALELIRFLGLESRHRHYPSELSGGEKQRIAIARALINRPKLILADEPTGNLDKEAGLRVLDLFKTINEEFNQTFIFVTHDLTIANTFSKHFHLENGVLQER